MKKNIINLIFFLIFMSSCATVKVSENGNTFVPIKKKPIKYPIKTENFFISGFFLNPEVWKTKRGTYFYYKECGWPIKRKRVKLKIKK